MLKIFVDNSNKIAVRTSISCCFVFCCFCNSWKCLIAYFFCIKHQCVLSKRWFRAKIIRSADSIFDFEILIQSDQISIWRLNIQSADPIIFSRLKWKTKLYIFEWQSPELSILPYIVGMLYNWLYYKIYT